MNIEIILTVLGVVAALFLFTKRSKKKPKTNKQRTGWFIGPDVNGTNTSIGMPEKPTPDGTGWYIDFPTTPDKHVHYVQWFDAPYLLGSKEITIKFTVTGGPFVQRENPSRPAWVSLLVQRKGDDWSAKGEMNAYRLFSRKYVVLSPGEFTMTVPLDFASWGGTQGAIDETGFKATLQNVSNISLVFGGPDGRGHGVYASAPTRFTLHSIEVVK